jgi:outer membrane lipoprotein-sorting protein
VIVMIWALSAAALAFVGPADVAGPPKSSGPAKAGGPTAPRPVRDMRGIASAAIAACDAAASLRAKIRIESRGHNGRAVLTDRSTGTYEQLRDNAVLKWRTVMTNKVTAVQDKIRGTVVEQDVEMVSNGRHIYTLTVRDGQKSVVRNDHDRERSVMADRAFFTKVAQQTIVKVLDDEEIDGHDCWVFETRPQRPTREAPARRRYYVRKDCGVRVKETAYDHGGQRIHITTITDLELNAPIEKKRFIFTAPEGVQVMDLTAR